MFYSMNVGRIHLPCCHYHVTHQRQLVYFTVIHKSSPVASWDRKMFIVHTGSSMSSGYFAYSFLSTVNSDILLLSHDVFTFISHFGCSLSFYCFQK